MRTTWIICVAVGTIGCGDDERTASTSLDGGIGESGAATSDENGEILALTYNVAGLPMGLSSSMPATYTPLIGPLLNDYELVLLQESWQTPDPNPGAPLRVYHEILVAASEHPYQTEPADAPWGTDPDRPSALLGDGLNVLSDFPLGETTRVRWTSCVDTASDCLALKGFSMTPVELADGVTVHVYDLHMEAGGSVEDDASRDEGIDLFVEFLTEQSDGEAVVVGGDFNLHTDEEPAATQFAGLLDETGLTDACTDQVCDRPGSIDKFLFRSSDAIDLAVESLRFPTDVFVTDAGEPLSDHDPLAVRFRWSAR